MAIVWADFPSGQLGLYGSTRDYMLNGVWAAFEGTFNSSFLSIQNDPDPGIGAAGRVLRFNQSSSTGEWGFICARFAYPVAVVTAGVAFRLWMSILPVADSFAGNPRWEFRNIANGLIGRMIVGASGQFLIYNAAGTLVHTSNPLAVVANAYNHVETKLLRDAAAGTIEIRVNGAVKVTLAAQALGASDVVNIVLGHNINVYYKDVIFWDGLGAYATDFQGSVAVHDLLTDADISLNWTPSTGATGWNLLDESPPNDGDYISADATPPAAAVFGLTNLPPDVTSVRALLPIFRGQKTDGGDCNLQAGLTPDNVAWVNGADRPQTVAFTYYSSPIHTSPVTAAPWTPGEVNAAYVRINRTL